MEYRFRLKCHEGPKSPKPGATYDCECALVCKKRGPHIPTVREQINMHSSRYNDRLPAHTNQLAASLANPTMRRRLKRRHPGVLWARGRHQSRALRQ